MMEPMIFDAISYREYALQGPKNARRDAILSFLEFIERKLGMVAMYPLSGIPRGRLELIDPYAVGQTLKDKGMLTSFERGRSWPDEPPIKLWQCVSEDSLASKTSGMSFESDSGALYAALAETLERYLWLMQWDYFDSMVRMTTRAIADRHVPFVAPERFVGFKDPHTSKGAADASYTWILGESLVSGKKTYIPAQAGSGVQFPGIKEEHIFRERSTCGSATWPTQSGARLRGMLELLERDAYMIMWLNQLTVPRIALDPLCRESPALDALIDRCVRYRLKVHALSMPTDAPTYAVCVVVEDSSGEAPRFAFGLRADRSIAVSVEKALLEALRARIAYRSSAKEMAEWNSNMSAEAIGHKDRLFYWGVAGHTPHLEFLIQGDEKEHVSGAWEHDSEEQHLERLVRWCREKSYECIAVSPGKSAMNPLSWHVETIVMPDLQRAHLTEKNGVFSGARLTDVPRLFNFSPRREPFTEAPHPFY